MLICLLAQTGSKAANHLTPEDKAMVHLMLIGAVLAIGLLMVVGLLIAWRNYNQRQRELDQAHEEREGDLPRPDAWATAAQRIEAEDTGPDEAHIAQDPDDRAYEDDEPQDNGFGDPDDEDEDDDDFPFDTGDDEDGDGPIGRA